MAEVCVASAAREVRDIVVSPECSSEDLWRFGVLQLLDDYESCRKRGGLASAERVFAEAPPSTGHSGLDAAFAALACWLAARDGWAPPAWARDSSRVARPWWFVSESAYGRAWAMVESPGEFRIRGVFITDGALSRA